MSDHMNENIPFINYLKTVPVTLFPIKKILSPVLEHLCVILLSGKRNTGLSVLSKSARIGLKNMSIFTHPKSWVGITKMVENVNNFKFHLKV